MVSEKERQVQQIQKIVYEINYLRMQGSELQKQLYSVQALLEENAEAAKALDALAQSKGSEALFPLGAGVFARATLSKTDFVLIDAGAKTSIEKSIGEAKAILSERRKKLEQLFNELRVSLNSVATRLQELEEQANELSAGIQGA